MTEKLCENKDFCYVFMPFEGIKIPFIIYADLECIIEEIDGCKDNPKNSSTTKVSKIFPSVFSKSTISSFRSVGNKHDVYSCKYCMKRFQIYSTKKTLLLFIMDLIMIIILS